MKKDAKGLNQALTNGWIKLLKEEGAGEAQGTTVRVVSCVVFPLFLFSHVLILSIE